VAKRTKLKQLPVVDIGLLSEFYFNRDKPLRDNAPPPLSKKESPRIPPSNQDPTDIIIIPRFPWPPPKASSKDKIPDIFFRKNEWQKIYLQNIERQISFALEGAGYFEKSYYAVPDGFAIVTRLEQINEDATSKPEPERWATKVGPLRRFSLSAYLRALFTCNSGYFRVIVFIVTPHPFIQADIQIKKDEAIEWLYAGMDKLPRLIGMLPYTNDYSCTALIYEFEKVDATMDAISRVPGLHTARNHLLKSKLWSKLRR